MKTKIFLLLSVIFIWVACTDEPMVSPIEHDTTPYVLNVGHFPQPDLPADNSLTVEKVKLGRMLFYEQQLSKDNSQSCASCHRQEHTFTDTARFSIGVELLPGKRQAMSVFNMAWHSNQFFWDGRANLLRDQALMPIEDPLEMNETLENVIAKLSNEQMYKDQFNRAFGDEEFLKAAQKNACYLKKNVITDSNEIMRNYKDGTASISGFLDDYAFVISSFIELYQVTFDEKWLNEAHELTEYTIEKFYDEQSGMFFYTNAEAESLISRKMEIQDNVIAASNSEMALNLFALGNYFSNEKYSNLSKQMLSNVQKDVHESAYFYANWARLEMSFVFPPFEVAIVGKDRKKMQRELDERYFPGMLLYGSDAESELELLEGKYVKGQTTIYVCQNKACKFPVTSVSEARKLLTEE